ncbi:hypothetical protein [Streptomyces sp. NRRL B-1677]|uniref:hypothetical protein n=1 Tax=Streptomyces sp. NRRL B-1677 TaxID=2682966 RepID=UPI001892B072|nr:hypothetical protein [Streptomyces sp. NRRL B-1677]
MNWDAILLFILATFGVVVLILSQIHEVLERLPTLIRAWCEVRRSWHEARNNQP